MLTSSCGGSMTARRRRLFDGRYEYTTPRSDPTRMTYSPSTGLNDTWLACTFLSILRSAKKSYLLIARS